MSPSRNRSVCAQKVGARTPAGDCRVRNQNIRYEGYKAEETRRAFLLGERGIDVVRILDRWRGGDHEHVKLDGSDGARYILR